MTIGATILRTSNIILRLLGENTNIQKFQAFRIDTNPQQEVLSNLEITNISYEDSAKFFEHPLETGATIVDHSIIDPNSIVMGAYISNSDSATLNELEFLYKNSIPLKIRVSNNVINRSAIQSKPFKVSSEHIDKDLYSFSIKEAQEVIPLYVSMPKAQNRANVSRVKSGVKQAQKVEKKKSWILSLFFGGRT